MGWIASICILQHNICQWLRAWYEWIQVRVEERTYLHTVLVRYVYTILFCVGLSGVSCYFLFIIIIFNGCLDTNGPQKSVLSTKKEIKLKRYYQESPHVWRHIMMACSTRCIYTIMAWQERTASEDKKKKRVVLMTTIRLSPATQYE